MTPELTAGYGEFVITPPLGVELCGYGFYRDRCAKTTLDDLKARAVCISAQGTTFILIACDLIGFDVETADQIRGAIAAEHQLPTANVLLACTHTHSGPASQALRGCGEISPEYTGRLPAMISHAVWSAWRDRRSCKLTSGSELAEPMGFNRRLGSFKPIDPAVSAVIFKGGDCSICVCAYACHAVTLGPNTAVSADWPGAVVKAIEGEGYRCLCFQGFCGDIDPVCNLNEWGAGSPDDLALGGAILRHHVLRIERNNQPLDSPCLTAVERRISLPLKIPLDREAIDREYATLRSKCRDVTFEKFLGECRRETEKAFDQLRQHPWRDNVPIQCMNLGGMNLMALPGEVFSEYGLKLRSHVAPLMAVGYANGNTGYWPTATAYADADDYAAYLAPKIYGVCPFASTLEETVLDACRGVLTACSHPAFQRKAHVDIKASR